MARVVISLLSLALTIYALIDCLQTPDDKVRHVSKIFWAILVLLVPWVGPISWLIAGRARGTSGSQRRPRSRGPRGPEDDPEFLRGL